MRGSFSDPYEFTLEDVINCRSPFESIFYEYTCSTRSRKFSVCLLLFPRHTPLDHKVGFVELRGMMPNILAGMLNASSVSLHGRAISYTREVSRASFTHYIKPSRKYHVGYSASLLYPGLAPLVLRGSCPQCSNEETRQIKKVLSHIQRSFPKEWNRIVQQYAGVS